MRIDRLSLSAFGRFAGRTLELGPGLNIIAGPNEAGKSTIQRFILGMLYGFKRRTQRRDYTEDLVRFRPWEGSDYRGSLGYTLADGRAFRVERLFEPTREDLRVYDPATSADLTSSFPMDRRKEVLFAEAHWKMSEEVFRSTAWVGQMEVSHLEMGRELVSRVANMQESGREDLSVRGALAALADRAGAIGSERAPTKPYGRLLRQIAAKQEEAVRAAQAREQTMRWEARLEEVRAELARLEAALAKAGEAERLAALEAATAAATADLTAFRAMAEAGAEVAGQVSTEVQLLEAEQERLASLQAEAEQLGAAIADLNTALSPLRIAGESGEAVLAKVERVEQELAGLRHQSEGTDDEGLKAAVVALEERVRGSGGGAWLVVGGVAVALAVAGILYGGAPGLIAAGVAGASALVFGGLFLRSRKQSAVAHVKLRDLRRTLVTISVRADEWQERIRQLERARDAALRSVGATSAVAIRGQMLRYEQLVTRLESQQGRLERVCAEVEQLGGATKQRSALLATTVGRALGRAPVAMAELRREVAAFRSVYEAYAELQRRYDSLTAEHQAVRWAGQEEIRRLEGLRSDLRAEASDLGARVETALLELPDTADLQRELVALVEERQGMEERLAALDLARRTIEEVSSEVHREFAPRLNEAMGAVVARVTDGRYQTVRIDEAMALRAIAAGDRTVDLLSLSAGTIDQFYLGLRLALLDLVTEGQEPVPLLLDDPFVQYDEARAGASMALLAETGRRRQVILFTCHQRDVRLAEALGGAHLITLSNSSGEVLA